MSPTPDTASQLGGRLTGPAPEHGHRLTREGRSGRAWSIPVLPGYWIVGRLMMSPPGPTWSQLLPDLSASTAQDNIQVLAKRPAERFGRAREFMAALQPSM